MGSNGATKSAEMVAPAVQTLNIEEWKHHKIRTSVRQVVCQDERGVIHRRDIIDPVLASGGCPAWIRRIPERVAYSRPGASGGEASLCVRVTAGISDEHSI